MVTELFSGIRERVAGATQTIIDNGRQFLTAGAMDSIHRDPSRLDGAIETMGPQAREFYNRLGPTGQENLKGIIAQDARFLPALARAMEQGERPGTNGQNPSSAFTSLPPGLTNAVLTEMNNDAQFRNRMIETLERDPSKLMEEVGREAGQDTRFGMTLGREGIRSAMSGELNLGSLTGGNMGGMMQGLMSGMLGGLMQNLGGLFDGLRQIFGQIMQSITGILGGDRMVQSVGDALPGARPIDAATRFAQTHGVRVQGTEYMARDGEVTTRSVTSDVTVSADTPMDPSRRAVLPDPTTGLAAGPR